METIQREITISTRAHEELIDITGQVEESISKSKIKEGLCHVYVPHATAAVIVNENADPGILDDILDSLSLMVPKNRSYRHDRIDGNAVSHIKAAILGPSETFSFKGGRLNLGTWQGILFCELDGPRSHRRIQITIIPCKQ